MVQKLPPPPSFLTESDEERRRKEQEEQRRNAQQRATPSLPPPPPEGIQDPIDEVLNPQDDALIRDINALINLVQPVENRLRAGLDRFLQFRRGNERILPAAGELVSTGLGVAADVLPDIGPLRAGPDEANRAQQERTVQAFNDLIGGDISLDEFLTNLASRPESPFTRRLGGEAITEGLVTGGAGLTRGAIRRVPGTVGDIAENVFRGAATELNPPVGRAGRTPDAVIAKTVARANRPLVGELDNQIKGSIQRANERVVEQRALRINDSNATSGGGVPPRSPGDPSGANAALPSPRQPHLGLEDDLNIPTWENPKDAAMRRWEGARNLESLSLEAWIKNGRDKLKKLRGTKVLDKAGSPTRGFAPAGTIARVGDVPPSEASFGPRTIDFEVDEETMRPLYEVLHGERDPSDLHPVLQDIYTDIRIMRDQEEFEMLEFLNAGKASDRNIAAIDAEQTFKRFLNVPDYFPRFWRTKKPPKGTKSTPGTTPPTLKGRQDDTFSEMLDEGFEPLTWNPYDMMAHRRMMGVEYRETVVFMNRLKSAGELLPTNEAPGNWVVPRINSPLFEGRTIGGVKTPELRVPRDAAGFIETAWGRLPEVNLGEREILSTVRKFRDAAKRLKLFGSLFQHFDIGTRAGGTGFTPTGILRGAPLRLPALTKNLVEAQWSSGKREVIRDRILSTKELVKGTGVTPRMLVEEGWGVLGDISLIKREVLNTIDEIIAADSAAGRAKQGILKAREFFEAGLFDGFYREAQLYALENFIVPQIKRKHKNWTARQVSGEAAYQVNVMFSTLGNWQTIFKDPAMREFMHTAFFSTNEQETLIRQALGTVKGPNTGLWREYYTGIFIAIAGVANAINMAATGKPLPLDSYSPVRYSPYDPFKVGYNSKFLSPQIPLVKGRNGQPVYLDLVGQMDTVARWMTSPIDALASRLNVPLSAAKSQITGESFFGEPLDTLPKRAGQLFQDLAAPIGATQLIGAAGEVVPWLNEAFVETESRLGGAGQTLQATGFNLRGEPQHLLLDRAARLGGFSVSYRDLEPYEKTDVRASEDAAAEILARNETRAGRNDPDGQLFLKIRDIEKVEQSKIADIDRRALTEPGIARSQYQRLQTEVFNQKKGARDEADFENVTELDTDLDNWYALGEDFSEREFQLGSATKAGRELIARRQQYLSSLPIERANAVLRNINIGTEELPPNLRRAFGLVGIGQAVPGASTKGQWIAASEKRRQAHRQERREVP
jgi:hypothetical protein